MRSQEQRPSQMMAATAAQTIAQPCRHQQLRSAEGETATFDVTFEQCEHDGDHGDVDASGTARRRARTSPTRA
ncbi:hypothetical protein HPK20_15700 [Vibrio fluvialis]|uniref:hypothetical protein n=1 Tax=Vibrio fluvialis TaxID=676 RepID=UPI001597B612|nr:hypothetical protein HPK20_15700 [Vibrio fluvialis]